VELTPELERASIINGIVYLGDSDLNPAGGDHFGEVVTLDGIHLL